jgi:chromosome segregation ATPase
MDHKKHIENAVRGVANCNEIVGGMKKKYSKRFQQMQETGIEHASQIEELGAKLSALEMLVSEVETHTGTDPATARRVSNMEEGLRIQRNAIQQLSDNVNASVNASVHAIENKLRASQIESMQKVNARLNEIMSDINALGAELKKTRTDMHGVKSSLHDVTVNARHMQNGISEHTTTLGTVSCETGRRIQGVQCEVNAMGTQMNHRLDALTAKVNSMDLCTAQPRFRADDLTRSARPPRV